MKVRVNKPLLLSGQTVPAGTIIDLPTESARLLGDRVEPAGRGRSQTQSRTADTGSDDDSEEAGDVDAGDGDEGGESDEASNDENENPKE